MQIQGRPFGSVALSMLATERAALVTRALKGEDSHEHRMQARCVWGGGGGGGGGVLPGGETGAAVQKTKSA